MTCTPETEATQADQIARAIEEGPGLDPGVENAEAQIAILRRKNLIAKQTIAILANENRILREGHQAAA